MTTVCKKWANMEKFLSRPSPFGNETGQLPNGYYVPSPSVFKSLNSDSKVLVVGAGGLGCEILKDLALSGVADIHVIGKFKDNSFWTVCSFPIILLSLIFTMT